MREGPGQAASSRRDEQLGIVETAAFFGGGADRLFGVVTRPESSPTGAAVICPAIMAESLPTYSLGVELARALAARGVAALRFHYRGTGHSDGDSRDVTFDTMCDDARAATEHLGALVDAGTPALVGIRFGGTVAAAASRDAATPIVLWEPVLDGKSYVREAWRASLMFEIREGAGAEAERPEFDQQLLENGCVDILGYPFPTALHESVVAQRLLATFEGPARSVLLAYGGTASSARGDMAKLVEQLRAAGHDVETETFLEPFVWWFLGPTIRERARPQALELVERTAERVAKTLEGVPA
jgi:hypothetical protein